MHSVKLEYMNDAHWPFLQAFSLPADQVLYTTLPRNLDNPLPEGVYPVVVVASVPVGFFLLHDNERVAQYTKTQDALLFSAFSIDYKAQRKGYAQAALHALPSFIREHFPHVRQVILSVNLHNESAFSLYKKAGFIDTGRRIGGPAGEQRIMSLNI